MARQAGRGELGHIEIGYVSWPRVVDKEPCNAAGADDCQYSGAHREVRSIALGAAAIAEPYGTRISGGRNDLRGRAML